MTRVTRRTALAAALGGLLARPAAALGYHPATTVPHGGVEGGDALILPEGDILNVRNIQGGVIGNPNLDIGAGSTEHPGDIVLNWDVGRRTLIYDGRKHLLASFGPEGITFYRKPRIRRRRA